MIETKSWWNEMKVDAREFKKSLQRDMMLRRYQKWSLGESTLEDRFMGTAYKARAYMVSSWRILIKRSLDLIFSFFGLVALTPALIVVAGIVKMTSPGPILHRQTRVGIKGKCFTMYKFRSMREDAETATGPMWAKEQDPRVTPFGDFMRKTHLDELPQLWNVLCGEMSLVGPRPERPHFVNQFRKEIPHYDARHIAKPGITGLAQIRRGYDEKISDVKKKLRYDMLYVQKMCPLLDIKVLALTVGACVLRTGR